MHPTTAARSLRLPAWSLRALFVVTFIVLGFLMALAFGAAVASADAIPGPGQAAPSPGDTVQLTGLPLAQVLIAFVVNAVCYVINYFGPHVSQQAKGLVILAANLLAGVIIEAVNDGNFGWNVQTGVMVFTSFVSALIAHGVLDKTGIAFALGAGRNKQTQVPTNTQRVLVGSV